MKEITNKFIILLFFTPFMKVFAMTEEEIAQSVDEKIITCGSAVRIQNLMTKF